MVIGDIHLPSIAGDGAAIELAATLYLPSLPSHERAPGLIVGHGAGSRRSNHDEFCRVACATGFVVLALDFRGHGESAGHADGPLEQDIMAAAAHLRGLPFVDATRICYRGSSMGGFYGLKSATQVGFAAAVLLCPADEGTILDAIDRAESEEQTTPRWDVESLRRYFRAQDSLRLASALRDPVLIVHARGDEVVPFDRSLRLTAALGGPATLMALPGGSHTSAQHDGEVHRHTVEWLLSSAAPT